MLGSRKILGVEIGRDDIRTVELKLSRKGDFFITGYAHRELGREVLEEGSVVDEDAFSEAFVQLCRESKYTAKHAVFGIDNQTTILRFAAFPKTDPAKQQGLVRLNAQEHIPVPISELELDFVQLGETSTEEGEFVQVLLCAVRKKTIQRILGISKDAGLNALMITPSQIAYANTILSRVDDDNFMAVRIGKKNIHHIVFENRQIAFMRNVNLDYAAYSVLNTLSRGEKLLPDEIEMISTEISRSVNATINYYRLRTKQETGHIIFTGATPLRQYAQSAFERELEARIDFVRLFEPDVRRGSSPPEDFDSCISLALSKT
jgi:type IV pilus assembly protein PilM